ncbi:MAG: DUF4118 domain-containing protein [Candidatus Rokubacteria bacterium]|nr:DUF4118 domain-containing protein [Candidatus Rokubacteria bacterium]
MTRQDSESGLWVAIGGIGAIAIGIALVPLRSVTSASNLAFVFLILTIVVAEFGGRAPGLATAVVSALSLNFFLTEPYLTLAIDKPDDVVAFVALAVSGLIAAAFGRRRARSSALVSGVRRDLEALERTAEGLAVGTSLEVVLEDLRRSFGLGGLVVRRADERLVAAAPPRYAGRAAPVLELEPRSLLATDERWHRLGPHGFRLPEGGGRLRLGAGGESFCVDLWEGDEGGLSLDESRALAIATAVLGLALRPGPSPNARR